MSPLEFLAALALTAATVAAAAVAVTSVAAHHARRHATPTEDHHRRLHVHGQHISRLEHDRDTLTHRMARLEGRLASLQRQFDAITDTDTTHEPARQSLWEPPSSGGGGGAHDAYRARLHAVDATMGDTWRMPHHILGGAR